MNKKHRPDAFQPPQKYVVSQACIDLLHSHKEHFLIPFLRRESGFEEARDTSDDLSNDAKASGSDDLKRPFDAILWIVFSLSSSSTDEDDSGTLSDDPHFDLIRSVKGRIPTTSHHHLKIRKIAAVPTSDFVGTANAQSIMILQEEACIDFEELVIRSEILESERLMKFSLVSPDGRELRDERSDTREVSLKISPPFVCWFVVENADDGNKPITSQVTLIEGTLYNGEPIDWHSSEKDGSLEGALEPAYGESEMCDSESRHKMIESKVENQFAFLTSDLHSSEYDSPIRICLTDEGNSPESEKERELSSELQINPVVSNFGGRHEKPSSGEFPPLRDCRHSEDAFLISKKVARTETLYELDIDSDETVSNKYVYRENGATKVLHNNNSVNLRESSQQSSPQNTLHSSSSDISHQVTTARVHKAASPKCEKDLIKPHSRVCQPLSISPREEDVEKRIASLELIVISQQESINTLRKEIESLKTLSDHRDSSFVLYKSSQEKVVEILHEQMRAQKTDLLNHIGNAFEQHTKKLEQMGTNLHRALHSKESFFEREIVELVEKINKIESRKVSSEKGFFENTSATEPVARRTSGTENSSLAQTSRPPAIETAPPSPLAVSSLNASNFANEGEEPPRARDSLKDRSATASSSRSRVSSNDNSKVHLDATADFTQKLAILDQHTCTGHSGSFLCDLPPAPFMASGTNISCPNRGLLNLSGVKTPLRTIPSDVCQIPNYPAMSTNQQSARATRGVLTPIRDIVENVPPILHTVGSQRNSHSTKYMPPQGNSGHTSVAESSCNQRPSTRTHILSHAPTKSEKENTFSPANAPASTLSDMLSRLEAKHKVKVEF